MSLLLKDRVYTMEAPTAKRGVYPLHGYKLGLYRLPVKLDEPLEIQSIHDGLKNTFEMDMYADRIFATYSWTEENMSNQYAKGYEKLDLNVTVEIVTGEVVDIIYQSCPNMAIIKIIFTTIEKTICKYYKLKVVDCN